MTSSSLPEIYLDNNATTRPLPEVIETVAAHLGESFGNPGSRHAAGRKACPRALSMPITSRTMSFLCRTAACPALSIFISSALIFTLTIWRLRSMPGVLMSAMFFSRIDLMLS